MAETIVIHAQGKFSDGITPGSERALRSLERLERRMRKVVKQSRQLSGMNVYMKMNAVDLASKKIREVMALGSKLNNMVFQPRVGMVNPKKELIISNGAMTSTIGDVKAKSKNRNTTLEKIEQKGGDLGKQFIEKSKETMITGFLNDRFKKYKDDFVKIGGSLKNSAKEKLGTGYNKFQETKIGKSAIGRVEEFKNSKAGKFTAEGIEKIKNIPASISASKNELLNSKVIQAVSEKVNKIFSNSAGQKVKSLLSRGGKTLSKEAPGIFDYAFAAHNIIKAKDKGKAVFKEGGGLLLGTVGGAVGSAVGGAATGALFGSAAGPVGTVVGAGLGFAGGVWGSIKGEELGEKLYDVTSKAGAKLKKGFKKLTSVKLPKIKFKQAKKKNFNGTKWNDSMKYNGMTGNAHLYQKYLREGKKKELKNKKTTLKDAKAKKTKTDPTGKRTTKKVAKQVKDVGSNSKKAGNKIQSLGKTSGGSGKQVAGLGSNSLSAGTSVSGMGNSASGAAGSLGMLTGAIAMAAANLSSLSFLSFGGLMFGGIQRNANGSFVGGKTLSWVGEDGPEVIIPLGGKRRKRGLDLWHQAGAMLGVSQHVEGGFVGGGFTGGKASNGKKNAPISVSVGNITIELKGNGDGTGKNIDLLKLLQEQKNQVSDEICTILADALESAYRNIPVAQ